MQLLYAISAALACITGISALVHPFPNTNLTLGNVKRAVPPDSVNVQLQDFTLEGNAFSGHIYIKNIAFQKVVNVFYSSAADVWPSNAADQGVPASFSASISGTNFETWVFSGTIGSAGIRHFYIRYDVSGQSFFDNNGQQNYDVGVTTTTSASSSSTSKSTSTITSTTMPISSTTSMSSTTTTSVLGDPTGIPADLPRVSDVHSGRHPPRGSAGWSAGFQDYRELTGYADFLYAADRKSAVVTVNAFSRTGSVLTYSFNGGAFASANTASVSSAFTGAYVISVKDAGGHVLNLDPLWFQWDAPVINRAETQGGQKVAIAELFGWPYADIEKECVFLGKAGWGGVRIWPPSRVGVLGFLGAEWGEKVPWWFVYQPVSYRLNSRHGTVTALRSMITTCRANGVRVYADAVVNHMSGGGNDILNHRGSGNGDCAPYGAKNATSGSPYYTHTSTYQYNQQTGLKPGLEFPAVPYGPTDFHCDRVLNAFTDPFQLNYGWLVGLADLNTEHTYVQERISAYFATLLSIGFSGFRIDAAKHMGPNNIAQILARLKRKMGGSFPADFITWLEVIIGGEKSLLACDSNDYNWYLNFNGFMSSAGLIASEIAMVKIWSSDYPKEFRESFLLRNSSSERKHLAICGSWILPPSRFVIQNDDHDQQSPGSSSRDMQSSGSVLIKDKNVATHRAFEVQLFTRTDFPDAGPLVRNVLSSYSFMDNGAAGFPDGLSDCSGYTGTASCISMAKAPAFDANACGYSVVVNGAWTQGVYTRVHRDLSIVNAMRGWMGLPSITAVAAGLPAGCT
ncbi:Alpha-amylase [Mycena venus]|uniref:Alpha-amylase n=1 Tax=Mycena venus TaxID=2733690 RepID=A0A8H6YJW7_9AGAR|nr:Alpha-amylase [Mycena venus]